MEIQKTNIIQCDDNECLVEIFIADSKETEPPNEFISVRVLVSVDANPLVAAVQKAALHRVRDVIGAQIQAATARAGR